MSEHRRFQKLLSLVLTAIFIAPVGPRAEVKPPVQIKGSVKAVPISRDIVAVAWVDPAPITLPPEDQVNGDLVSDLNGATGVACLNLLRRWRDGFRESVNTDTDRRYANGFLLKNSPNARPPETIDPNAFMEAGDYRLFNRAKVEFAVKDGKIFGLPRFVHIDLPVVGKTPEPCTFLAVRVAGQSHPQNGARGRNNAQTTVFQLNEGRIGTDGQAADRTLNACNQFDCAAVPVGPTTPWIWSAVKFDVHGNLIQPIDKQIFPTYSIYSNRARTAELGQSNPETFISLDETSQRLVTELQ